MDNSIVVVNKIVCFGPPLCGLLYKIVWQTVFTAALTAIYTAITTPISTLGGCKCRM